MAKIRAAGVALGEYVSAKPYRGLLTGFNDAFNVETLRRDEWVREDPRLTDLLKPYLRGRDVKRWSPTWAGWWMIMLRSSENHVWPWSGAPEMQAEEIFAREYPVLYRHFKPFEAELRKRDDQGKYWWELRSCAYYDAFERPKIVWKDLAFHSAFAFDSTGLYTNDLCFILPCEDPWLLAILNSPLMWAYLWRNSVHGKDEVLRLKNIHTVSLPIASPPTAVRRTTETPVEALISLTKERQDVARELLSWLASEFGLEAPGQNLEAFAELGAEEFVREVRKRRPRAAGRLGPRDLTALTDAYHEYAPRMRRIEAEMEALEARLAEIVYDAYGLTRDDVDLLWRTAPPRMPGKPPTPASGAKAA